MVRNRVMRSGQNILYSASSNWASHKAFARIYRLEYGLLLPFSHYLELNSPIDCPPPGEWQFLCPSWRVARWLDGSRQGPAEGAHTSIN